jgi:hypothetical protein
MHMSFGMSSPRALCDGEAIVQFSRNVEFEGEDQLVADATWFKVTSFLFREPTGRLG